MGESKRRVYLVGAGPGDPKLLTLRGKECLEQADVVLYDYLANPALLEFTAPHTERVYVGRRGRGQYLDQGTINRMIIERAQAGKIVVRLKGGDPFVFGRGGEEAEAIAAAGIEFEVVPGVTAAVAAPAYAGIPVTHRTLASTVAFVTGHEDPSKGESALEWPKLATAHGTLVFLMGMKNLPGIVDQLLAQGKSPSTPAALIRWGTRPNQRTVVGTLADIVGKAEAAQMEPPTVIVIGDVVNLRAQLNWFEKRPLFGKRILVTRAKEQAAEFSRLLAAYGAETIECPTIQIVPPESWRPVDDVIGRLDRFHWLIFTSLNGVGPFMKRLRSKGLDGRAFAGLRICCIGPRTAQELAEYGLAADLVPPEYQAEGVIASLTQRGVKGQRILIPRAAVARDILPEQLRAQGAEVEVVPVYRTTVPASDVASIQDRIERGELDIITFTSSSTVRNFVQLLGGMVEQIRTQGRIRIACIGPITASTVKEYRLPVHILPSENTIPALAEAIVQDTQGRGEPERAGSASRQH